MPVVTALPQHIPEIARLHRASIRTGLTAYLGQRFCERLYAGIARSPEAVLFVLVENGQVLGFAAGARDTTQMYRDVRRTSLVKLALAAGPRLLSPRVMKSAFSALQRPQRFSGERFRDWNLPEAELFSIGVSELAQGRGNGRAVAFAVLNALADKGVRQCRVWTSQENQRALRFYQSCGFEYRGQRADRAGDIHLLVRRLDDLTGAPSTRPGDAHEPGREIDPAQRQR